MTSGTPFDKIAVFTPDARTVAGQRPHRLAVARPRLHVEIDERLEDGVVSDAEVVQRVSPVVGRATAEIVRAAVPPVRLLEALAIDAGDGRHPVDEVAVLGQAQHFAVVENQRAQNQILPSSALGP